MNDRGLYFKPEFGCALTFKSDDRREFEKALKWLRADAKAQMPKGSRIEWRAQARGFRAMAERTDDIAWYSNPRLFDKQEEWDFPMADFEDIRKIKPSGDAIVFGRETI